MTQTIHKYRLLLGTNFVQLPIHCSILSAGEQNGALMMWVRLDPDRPKAEYQIAVVGTGQPVPEDDDDKAIYWQFIQTVQVSDGVVWHVFVRVDLKEAMESHK